MFYLVCGGEMVPEREKQDREQRKMIYETIISQGLAKKDQIVFVNGRGKELNPTFKKITFPAKGFRMYGPCEQQLPALGSAPGSVPTCNLPAGFSRAPSSNDNAVVIYFGQGNYTSPLMPKGCNGFGVTNALQQSVFGNLVFNFDNGTRITYQPELAHLVAKNTLFISLADYTERAFERAFEAGRDQTSPGRLLAVCLSNYYHGSIDKSLGKAFAEFFAGDEWKNKAINSFCETLEYKYESHPNVQEAQKTILRCTVCASLLIAHQSGFTAVQVFCKKQKYEEERKERNSWAFQHLDIGDIPQYAWTMFEEVDRLRDTVDSAGEMEMSSDIRGQLSKFVSKMEAMRVDITETSLLKPRAYKLVGDKDFITMTWKDFLNL